VVLLSVADAPDVARRFMASAWGRMSQDPQVRPLVDQVYASAVERVGQAQDQIGLSLDQLAAIPQGEVTVALVAPAEGPPAFVFLLDAGDHLPDARKLLEKARETLERSGAQGSQETVSGTVLSVYDRTGPRQRPLVLFEKDGVVGAGSSVEVIKQVLAVWDGGQGATLVDNPTFNAVMSHCMGARDEQPQAVFYFNPMLLLECIGRDNAGAMMAVNMAPVLGLNGLKAIGGSVALDVGGLDSIIHAQALLDSPRKGVLEVIALDPGNVQPEKWVPSGVASYTTLHVQPEKIYQTVTKLYDGFRGEGAFAAAVGQRLGRLAEMDFEKDVLPTLDGRLTHMVWMERPVTVTSQATLVGLKLKDAKALAKVLDKVVVENRPFLEERALGGRTYFQYAPPQVSDEPPRPNRPRPCFGILDGYLVVADRPGLYEEAIRTAADPSKSLASAADFKRVMDELHRRSGAAPAVVSFERPQEGLRVAYEAAVAQRIAETPGGGRNPFLRTINAALGTTPLPPFAALERYLAPRGAVLVDEAGGLHYVSFTLKPQAK
jgi:hypothetical protein